MKSIVAHSGCEVTIGSLTFNYVHAIDIKSSWKTLNDVCTIQLPNQKDMLAAINSMEAGASVTVKLGYDGDLYTEFEGYVKSVSANHPYTVTCWDGMWNLAQQEVSMSWESTTLKEVVQYLVGDAIVTDVPDVTLSPFSLDRKNVPTKAQALQKLKDEYGLVAYFRGTQLYVGLAYYETGLGEYVYHFEKNVAKKSNNLKFKRAEDVKVKVKGISILPDNTKVEVNAGDSDGDLRTLHFYDLTEAELKQQVEDKVNLMKYSGYRGSFMSKGVPRPVHGGTAKLLSAIYPERNGSYLIDEVHTTFNGQSGFSRKVTLGRLADASLISAN
jgi:hypothetical protein